MQLHTELARKNEEHVRSRSVTWSARKSTESNINFTRNSHNLRCLLYSVLYTAAQRLYSINSTFSLARSMYSLFLNARGCIYISVDLSQEINRKLTQWYKLHLEKAIYIDAVSDSVKPIR